jgi:hypothetical protein
MHRIFVASFVDKVSDKVSDKVWVAGEARSRAEETQQPEQDAPATQRRRRK